MERWVDIVDIVDTDFDEDEVDLERFLDPFICSSASALRLRPRSSSFFARTSSATPSLRSISLRVDLFSERYLLSQQIVRGVASQFRYQLRIR